MTTREDVYGILDQVFTLPIVSIPTSGQIKMTTDTEVPELYKAGYIRALSGGGSPRSAIKAFCLYCVGYVRKDVTDCQARNCPLWAFRPYQKGEDK